MPPSTTISSGGGYTTALPIDGPPSHQSNIRSPCSTVSPLHARSRRSAHMGRSAVLRSRHEVLLLWGRSGRRDGDLVALSRRGQVVPHLYWLAESACRRDRRDADLARVGYGRSHPVL